MPKPKHTSLASLKREDFNSYESGKIIAGTIISRRTEIGLETHECYQYDSFEEVLAAVNAFCGIAGMERVQVVTHAGQYEKMRSLYFWEKAAKREPLLKRLTLLSREGVLLLSTDTNPFEANLAAMVRKNPDLYSITFEVQISDTWLEVGTIYVERASDV